MALKKLCRCGKVIEYRDSYCERCMEEYADMLKQKDKLYDMHTRDKRSKSFYNSPGWIQARKHSIEEYAGLDIYAYYVDDKVVHADTVHHIEELKDSWDRRLDPSNLVPLSAANHRKIHRLYSRDKEQTQRLLIELKNKFKTEFK